MQLGEAFTLKGFMDKIYQVGLIPASIMHWEMTEDDEPLHPMLYEQPSILCALITWIFISSIPYKAPQDQV